MLAGVGLAALASANAVKHATAVVEGSKLPAFVVGSSLVAIGTDLPEIANSITASLAGHGDLNVGDSIGSAATQITLVLGLLPFLSRRTLEVERAAVGPTAMAMATALGLGILLFSDGHLSRLDGGLLVGSWGIAAYAIYRVGAAAEDDPRPEPPPGRVSARLKPAFAALGFFVLVGLGATIGVLAFVEIAAILGIPEYIISFFAASLATSLPELLVDLAAIRTGQVAMALGDAFGSSLVDSSLSIGIGPLIAPTAVSAEMATRGSVGTLVALGVVTTVMMLAGRWNRWTGALALLAYAGLYFVLLR
jgi:cation:H+ antiporter